jgi:carboxyl-terminal processing protease
MPEGYIVESADGRSLNNKKVIQDDSDYTGQGGVIPDIKIPLNEDTFKAMYLNGQDVELNYAIDALK